MTDRDDKKPITARTKKTAVITRVKSSAIATTKKPETPTMTRVKSSAIAIAIIKKPDMITTVLNKYTERGWTAIRAPKNSTNDIIAQKDKRLHFVQVVTASTINDSRFNGLSKTTFIQNAFSNGAQPVFAHVVQSRGIYKITFEDVNLNGRIIIDRSKKEKLDI